MYRVGKIAARTVFLVDADDVAVAAVGAMRDERTAEYVATLLNAAAEQDSGDVTQDMTVGQVRQLIMRGWRR